jgi:rare lipoprotein A
MQAAQAFALMIGVAGLAALPAVAKAEVVQPAQTTLVASPAKQDTAKPEAPKAPKIQVIERGEATWYDRRNSKRFTYNGERFDPSKLTAAHRNLPIGSMVRVTDDATGRSVIVRINDREPPHGVRCIDLSEGAAKVLGIRGRGVADVTISALNPSDAIEVAEAPDDEAEAPAPRRVRHTSRHSRR